MASHRWVTTSNVAKQWDVSRKVAIRRLEKLNEEMHGMLLMTGGKGTRRRHLLVNIIMLDKHFQDSVRTVAISAVLSRVRTLEAKVSDLEEQLARKVA